MGDERGKLRPAIFLRRAPIFYFTMQLQRASRVYIFNRWRLPEGCSRSERIGRDCLRVPAHAQFVSRALRNGSRPRVVFHGQISRLRESVHESRRKSQDAKFPRRGDFVRRFRGAGYRRHQRRFESVGFGATDLPSPRRFFTKRRRKGET